MVSLKGIVGSGTTGKIMGGVLLGIGLTLGWYATSYAAGWFNSVVKPPQPTYGYAGNVLQNDSAQYYYENPAVYGSGEETRLSS